MMIEASSITFDLPDWFLGIFSLGLMAMVFFIGSQWTKVREVCADFPKIRRALDMISGLLLTKGWTDGHLYVSAQSPVKLTDAGKKMLEESQFEDFFAANKKMLFDHITTEKPKTESEVETASRTMMLYLDTKTTPKMDLVENFSYNNGKAIANLLYAYSIEIRDRYLKEIFSLHS